MLIGFLWLVFCLCIAAAAYFNYKGSSADKAYWDQLTKDLKAKYPDQDWK